MFRKKTKKRSVSPEYKKQPIYSYGSSRKESGRQFNRGESVQGEGSGPISRFVLSSTKLAVLLLVLIGVFYFQTLDSNAKVKLTGEAPLRSNETYQKAVEEELTSSRLNYSKFTFNSQKTIENLKNKFPEVESIDISLPFFQHQPKVEIKLAKPIALLVTSEKTYFIDSSGRALFSESDVSSFYERAELITVNDTSGHQITLGKPALTSSQIGFINELKGQTASRGLSIDSITLARGGSAIDVMFKDTPYLVKFSFTADARQSSGAYLAMRDQIARDNIKVSEYVDMRIPDRAYIK